MDIPSYTYRDEHERVELERAATLAEEQRSEAIQRDDFGSTARSIAEREGLEQEQRQLQQRNRQLTEDQQKLDVILRVANNGTRLVSDLEFDNPAQEDAIEEVYDDMNYELQKDKLLDKTTYKFIQGLLHIMEANSTLSVEDGVLPFGVLVNLPTYKIDDPAMIENLAISIYSIGFSFHDWKDDDFFEFVEHSKKILTDGLKFEGIIIDSLRYAIQHRVTAPEAFRDRLTIQIGEHILNKLKDETLLDIFKRMNQ